MLLELSQLRRDNVYLAEKLALMKQKENLANLGEQHLAAKVLKLEREVREQRVLMVQEKAKQPSENNQSRKLEEIDSKFEALSSTLQKLEEKLSFSEEGANKEKIKESGKKIKTEEKKVTESIKSKGNEKEKENKKIVKRVDKKKDTVKSVATGKSVGSKK